MTFKNTCVFNSWLGEADFVAIYVILPLLAQLGMHLESRFCRYLRDSALAGTGWDALGGQILSQFA